MQNRCRGGVGRIYAKESSLQGFKKAEAIHTCNKSAKTKIDYHKSRCNSRNDGLDLQSLNVDDFNILVAKCGKTIGLNGEIRLIVYSDFSEIFTKGNVFLAKDFAHSSSLRGLKKAKAKQSKAEVSLAICESKKIKMDCHDSTFAKSRNDKLNANPNVFFLTLQSFNPHRQSATFDEIKNIDEAKNLTSLLLYSTKSLTQKYCVLGKNEHFWFDIVGMSVVDGGEVMGVVSEIERVGSVDYLLIATNPAILAKYPHIKAKKFYLPYISRYILSVGKGVILVQDSLGVLEES